MVLPYRPILRWKRGEQSALLNLFDSQKRATIPVISILGHQYNPPLGLDVDTSFDSRLALDAEKLRTVWNGHRVSVDLNALDADAVCAGGDHFVTHFFRTLGRELDARPVLRGGSEDRYVGAVAALPVPPTFRLTPDDLAEPDIAEVLHDMLEMCEVAPSDCDVVIDLGYLQSAGRGIMTARGAIQALPYLHDWESVALSAGSFPENLSPFSIGIHSVPRHEWDVWQAAIYSAGRPVAFGDYATIHPIPVEEGLDPRVINPTASVRYTFEATWLLLRGEGTRNRGGRGFAQFQDHARGLVAMREFRGDAFSYGDDRIGKIARGEIGQGNLETWVTIGINHHIAEVVGQLATLP